jgi:hypothetical protein
MHLHAYKQGGGPEHGSGPAPTRTMDAAPGAQCTHRIQGFVHFAADRGSKVVFILLPIVDPRLRLFLLLSEFLLSLISIYELLFHELFKNELFIGTCVPHVPVH